MRIGLIPTRQQWKRWSLPSKLTAIGTLIGVISLGLVLLPMMTKPSSGGAEGDSNREYRRLLLASAQELRSNRDCFDKYRLYLSDAAAHSPVCMIGLDHTRKLFADHHSQVIAHSYGEQKYLFQEVLQLDASSRLLPVPVSRGSLAQWNETHEMTVDDLAFISGFLFWYLVGLASTELDEREYHSLGWFAASPQFVPASEGGNLRMRRYLFEGEPITDYRDYLGLID